MNPTLESTGIAVLAWLHARQSYDIGEALKGKEGVVSHQVATRQGLSVSAQAAVHVHQKIKRLVALSLLKEVRLCLWMSFML